MKILLAEDDEQLAAQLVRLLESENFVVDHAADGIDANHLGLTGDYDCVILDLGLPAMKGETILQHWRGARREFPVLVLTARDAWVDKAAAFGAGADDYLTKPFLSQELVVRLRALARRARGQAAQPIYCDDLSYHPTSGEFRMAGEPLKLTAFEHRILAKLFQYQGSVVSRDRLFDSMYGENDMAPENSLEVMIGRIRRKIGADKLLTLRGHGYSLCKGAQ
ncbi:response regulator [Duganella sp. FT80W]|uniref:Response regulator n=1 Tax=Duganella guangzhouensis TaxID=2666084 RepID=A0A6I2L001_9BURK|nr:response regulator transcription factor [Duganella guangzhouensis]MRW91468.1 response regulator [Duganella guangzhouensis]